MAKPVIPNGSVGVWIGNGATNNTIGPGNVISGNDAEGVVLSADATVNRVIGNRIGTDASGVLPLPNANDGIQIRKGATGNTIGGASPEESNVVSGNFGYGITIGALGDPCVDNIVRNNFIGTDLTGTIALGNLGPR